MNRWRTSWIAALGLAGTLLVSGASPARAQTATVRGTVRDSASQRPLEGAQVSVEGTSTRTSTRADGQYILANVPTGSVTIQVRLIGYSSARRTATLAAGQNVTIDFDVRSAAISLEDMVVVGYGTQRRTEASTATSTVTASEIQNTPIASADAALQGKAPGVEVVQNAGNPGNGISVRVRGSASITASSQPLYIVDGVPLISDPISQLDAGGQSITGVTGLSMNDIETLDVLKDAGAAAIYGSRGSNGVVMITTKRGRPGKSQVSLNAYWGTQSASRRLPLMNSKQYLAFFNEAAENDGYGADYFGVAGVDDQVNTDWQDAVLRRASVGNTELAVSGGDERIRYRLSGSYFDQNGIVLGSAYQRLAGRANLDFDTSDRLGFSATLAVSGERDDRIENDGSSDGIITNAVGNQPLFPVKLANGDFNSPADDLQYSNSVALATINTMQARTMRVLGNIEGRLAVRDNLQFTSRLGVDLLNLREGQFQSGRVLGTYAASAGGVAKSGYQSLNRYVLDNFLTFTPVVGARKSLQLTAGSSIEENRGELNFIRGEGLSNDQFTDVANATVLVAGDGSRSESNLLSFFGRANFGLSGKYLFGASLRTDGSSKFGKNDRWGVFPAVSAAWVLSEESFMANNRIFDDLKLRASYGRTGNQAISDFPSLGLFGSANYGDVPGLAPSNLANPDLRWETTKQFDIGVDAGLFGGRVNLTFDYYRKNTNDLLLDRPITCTSGFCSVFDNVGSVQNKGVEFGITSVILNSAAANGLRWSSTLNFAANRNKVTGLFNDQPFTGGERNINRVEVGQELGAFYTLQFLGVDPATGDAIYKDVDGDGSITAADRVIVGSPHPRYTGGWINNVSMGRFDLNVFVQFSHGAKVFNAMRLFSGAGGYYEDNQFTDQLNRWQNPGDVTDTPRASYDGTSGARTISSRFIENGSYLRLQEVTLGYDLPSSVAGLLRLDHARLYVTGHNLATSSDYTGYSPDVNSNGSGSTFQLGTDFYAYPQARTFTFGINAGW
jgi:TonB-linked SusC/RagA family outer membrane protein